MEKEMKKYLAVGIFIALIFVIFLSWDLISPLFIDKTVNEESPVNLQENLEMILSQGSFMDADSFHKTSGKAIVFKLEDKQYLRFEDFKATNGPDLKVYLSKDLEAKEYVSLGDLKGNIGPQNYELPKDVDATQYKYVLVWCERFSVLFGYSDMGY